MGRKDDGKKRKNRVFNFKDKIIVGPILHRVLIVVTDMIAVSAT